jgi:hypothetical protein
LSPLNWKQRRKDLWPIASSSLPLIASQRFSSSLCCYSKKYRIDVCLTCWFSSFLSDMPDCLYWNLLFLVHISRRIWECLFLHKFSAKYVHFYKLPAAWLFYFMVWLSFSFSSLIINLFLFFSHIEVILSMNVALINERHPPHGGYYYVGLALFLIGKYDLSSLNVTPDWLLVWAKTRAMEFLRIVGQKRKRLAIRSLKVTCTRFCFCCSTDRVGFLFRWVSCPHYLCEICIYLSFTLMCSSSYIPMYVSHSTTRWLNSLSSLIFVFVCANLSSTAVDSHAWYRNYFGSHYPPERKAILPFILWVYS